jgi:thiol:disulfide interchange protein DsbD
MLYFANMTRFVLLLLLAMPAAYAQDDEPLRPEDAYRYVVSDTGDALEVDWAIEDEYYLYRNELSFETTADGVTLGEARLPAGEPHEGEWYGKQQVFR